jgi:cytochrome c oxidase assembly protein subunit 11
MSHDEAPSRLAQRHRLVALSCAAFVVAMVSASYAAVPLYDLFCRVTGFAGRPVRANGGPNRTADRRFEIRFDSNVNGLAWRFLPEEKSVFVHAGEVKTVSYRIANTSWNETVGIASYNVTPEAVAPYFSKIACFCFSEQRLAAGQSLELPVVFFIDPAIVDNRALDSVTSVTLSYTFFPESGPPVADAKPLTDKPKL